MHICKQHRKHCFLYCCTYRALHSNRNDPIVACVIIVTYCRRLYLAMGRLPRICLHGNIISELLPSNGFTCHSMLQSEFIVVTNRNRRLQQRNATMSQCFNVQHYWQHFFQRWHHLVHTAILRSLASWYKCRYLECLKLLRLVVLMSFVFSNFPFKSHKPLC
jgi:hypothetical protein